MSILKAIVFQCFYSLLLIGSPLYLVAQNSPSQEYKLKAAFLFNFTQFVEWPTTTFYSVKAPIIIGIYGEDPFGSYIDEMVKGEEVNGHPLIIQRYNTLEEIKKCHILFINAPKSIKQMQIVASLKGKNILSVGETNNFIREGGIVKFFTIDNKIHFQINPDAAKDEGLVISSKLLRLAEISTTKKN